MNMKTTNFNLTTDGMQLSGKHFMGNGIKDRDIDPELLAKAQEKAEQDQLLYVDNMMQKDKDCKSYDDKTLIPVGNRIVCKPYEKNPYRKPLRETTSGLILGDFESYSSFKSNDTGEEEAAQRGIWCCEVLYVGSDCKTVKPGDDVYINFPMAAPVPFGSQGFYSIGEPNVICVIRKKE